MNKIVIVDSYNNFGNHEHYPSVQTMIDIIKRNYEYINIKNVEIINPDELCERPNDITFIYFVPSSIDTLGGSGGFWNKVPHEVKKRITDGNGYLFLNFPTECNVFLPQLFQYLDSNKIPRRKSVWVSGSTTAKKDHDLYCERHNQEKLNNIISFPFWSYLFDYKSVITRERGDIDMNDFLLSKNRQKYYLNLNRRLRRHRPLMTSLLSYHNLLDKGYVSAFSYDDMGDKFNINEIKKHTHTWVLEEDFENDELSISYKKSLNFQIIEGYNKIKNKLPLVVDTSDGTVNYASHNFVSEKYLESYFSLVSETHFDEVGLTSKTKSFSGLSPVGFFTEKTFKPIAHKHPFILISSPGALKELKKLGYKTFSKWIDESYDDIRCSGRRMYAIVKEVERLCSLPKHKWDEMISEMSGVLNHNYDMLVNKRHLTLQNTNFSDIGKYSDSCDKKMFVKEDKQHVVLANKDHEFIEEMLSVHKNEGDYIFEVEGDYPIYESNSSLLIYDLRYLNKVTSKVINHINSITKKYNISRICFALLEEEYLFPILESINDYRNDLEKIIGTLKNISLATNNSHSEDVYEHYLKNNEVVKIEGCYWYPRWGAIHMSKITKNLNLPMAHLNVQKNKKYICLNRLNKEHRVKLVYGLFKMNLLNKGYVSLQDQDAEGNLAKSVVDSERFISILPLNLDGKWYNNAQPDIPYKMINESYFNLATETVFYQNMLCNTGHLTEKIFKPLVMCQPFVVCSTPGTLSALRKLGYRTFNKWIDESYDTITDPDKRMNKVLKEVNRLCFLPNSKWDKMLEEMRDILMHNQKRALDTKLDYQRSTLRNLFNPKT